jgi:hypothetical protein
VETAFGGREPKRLQMKGVLKSPGHVITQSPATAGLLAMTIPKFFNSPGKKNAYLGLTKKTGGAILLK